MVPRRHQLLQEIAGDDGRDPVAPCPAVGCHLQPQPGPLQLQKDRVMPGPRLWNKWAQTLMPLANPGSPSPSRTYTSLTLPYLRQKLSESYIKTKQSPQKNPPT